MELPVAPCSTVRPAVGDDGGGDGMFVHPFKSIHTRAKYKKSEAYTGLVALIDACASAGEDMR